MEKMVMPGAVMFQIRRQQSDTSMLSALYAGHIYITTLNTAKF